MVIPSQINLNILYTIGVLVMASLAIVIRLRAAKKPTSVQKILMPPLGMSTGFFMFVVPETHIPLMYALMAFIVGLLFSTLLIRTTNMEIVNGDIFVKRSKAFMFILFGLLAARIVLHDYVQHYVSVLQTGAIFFILAFGMLVPWRITMYYQFRRIQKCQFDSPAIEPLSNEVFIHTENRGR